MRSCEGALASPQRLVTVKMEIREPVFAYAGSGPRLSRLRDVPTIRRHEWTAIFRKRKGCARGSASFVTSSCASVTELGESRLGLRVSGKSVAMIEKCCDKPRQGGIATSWRRDAPFVVVTLRRTIISPSWRPSRGAREAYCIGQCGVCAVAGGCWPPPTSVT